jgi:hypothetical protein
MQTMPDRTKYLIDPPATLKIIPVEPNLFGPVVVAQFNPKEVQVDDGATWTYHHKTSKPSELEFTGSSPSGMSFELMFDGFDSGTCVIAELDKLRALIKPVEIGKGVMRPPKVIVIWAAGEPNRANPHSPSFPRFEAVVESVNVKYTMFSADGTVLRATASVKLKSASAQLTVGKDR